MSQIAVEMTGKEANLWRAYQRLVIKQKEMDEGLKSVGRSGRRAGKEVEEGFGSKVVASFAKVAGGAGIGLVTAALRQAEQEADLAAGRIRQMAGDVKDLVQISEGVRGLRQGEQLHRRLRAEYGFDEATARMFAFQLRSAGATTEEVFQAGRVRAFEKDPVNLALAVEKLRSKFGQEVLGGTPLSIMGALGRGGIESQLSAAQLANLALTPLSMGKELGMAPAAVIAATSLATKAAPTPEEARTQVSQFLNALRKDEAERFKDIGLQAALDKFRALPEVEQKAVLGGRKEALLGAGILLPAQEEIRRLTAEILRETRIAETPEGYVARKIALAGEDPRLRAQLAYEKALARQEFAEEAEGVKEVRQDAVRAQVRAMLREKGAGVLERFATGAYMAAMDWVGAAPERMAREGGRLVSPTFYFDWQDPSGRGRERQRQTMNRLLDAAGAPPIPEPEIGPTVRIREPGVRPFTPSSFPVPFTEGAVPPSLNFISAEESRYRERAAGTERALAALQQASANLNDAAEKMRGGPTFAPPTEDR